MSHTTDFQADDAEKSGAGLGTEIAYRPISSAAIVTLVLGLLSPLALFWRVLWLLPLLGVFVGAIALQGIRKSEGGLAGRPIALTGLMLSLVLGSLVLAADFTRTRVIVAQGTPWAMRWCELLLEGRTEEALELKQEPSTRRPLSSLEAYYQENESAKARLAEFREEPLVTLLTSAPEGSRIAAAKVLGVDRRSNGAYALVRYFVLHPPPEAEPGAEPVSFLVEVDKDPARGLIKGGWYVKAYRLASE